MWQDDGSGGGDPLDAPWMTCAMRTIVRAMSVDHIYKWLDAHRMGVAHRNEPPMHLHKPSINARRVLDTHE